MALMLLDAATLYYRAFYALPASMTDGRGRPVNAVRGFLDAVRVLRDAHQPERIIACWDADWRPQWRVDLVPSYKTHRVAEEGEEEVPDLLEPQVPVIAALCRALGIAVVEQPGMEADDVIAAIALNARGPIDVVSGDRDLLQLVDDGRRCRMLYLGTGVGAHTVYDEALVRATHGVEPRQYADLATLRGDPSDGLPGAPGIGAKTAATYLQAFGDLEGILKAAETVTPPITKNKADVLLREADALRATRSVVTLRPAHLEVPELARDEQVLARLVADYGLTGVMRRWEA